MNFLEANIPFAVSAMVIAQGWLLRRTGVLKDSDGEALARVALNVTLPALILLNVPSVPLNASTAILPLFTLAGSALTVLLGLFFLRKQPPADRGLSLASASGYNIGLFAMPMVAGIYGSAGIARFALLDIGNMVGIFITSYYLAYHYSTLRTEASGGMGRTVATVLKSVPVIAYFIALGLNLAGLEITGVPRDFLGIFAGMNRGVALLTLGVLLKFRFPAGTWKAILPPLLLRYGFGAVVAALVLAFLPMEIEYRVTIASVMVMPMGLILIPYAVKWGYDRDRAAAIINMGIPISFVLFWAVWFVSRMIP